jgi:hypothetical protein
MRTYLIVLGSAITASALTFGVIYASREGEGDSVSAARPVAPPVVESIKQTQRPERDVNVLRRQQGEINSDLAAITKRLVELEAAEQTRAQAAAAATPEPGRDLEREFGDWLDDRLAGQWQEERSRSTSAALAKALESSPGLELLNTDCAQHFCKATVLASNGKLPSLSAVLGDPSLAQEGFSVLGTDGSVAIYFTPPSETFAALRDEAKTQLN